ncbi:MAG TPA: dTDP-4-dehydrorhamnose 3,5-epimerase [Vicinamibacterales bacterium]|nr:dTDP-4-dehydrorhamnose 3,5-epimerase [Vicinamibacterales bacterium]
MVFLETALPDLYVLEPERVEDERGFFARIWQPGDFIARGLNPKLAHVSVSFNRRKGTLRGLHYQTAPMAEAKIVRCGRGAVFDVVVDLRHDSPAFTRWVGVELSDDNGRALYIPEGCAHGFQTLRDNTELLYFISAEYSPEHARGVRWNDPVFGITWPDDVRTMNERDRSYPDFQPAARS